MKIIDLEFKNLNSLSGEWHIDFTTPEYTSNGIFAIIGPTGAGKSTILDAICLALYGKTPRLESITKKDNEIMSQQTGDCYSKVIFETQTGKFRCCWSQQKANKRANGNLQESKHEISDAISGQLLESKKRNVANVIEKKTGMNFDRFTRSILLAQGGFAAFLQANSSERGPILEQITGTEIYSEISKRVHERKQNEHKELKSLQAEIDEITILSDEQEKKIHRDLSDNQKTDEDLSVKITDISKSINWLSETDTLKKEIEKINKEYNNISEKIDLFKPERKQLETALKAAELEGKYATLSSMRQQQKTDITSLNEKELSLPQLKQNLTKEKTNLENAEIAVKKARNNKETEFKLIREVRELDLLISEKHKTLEAANSDYKKDETLLSDKKDELKKILDAKKPAIKQSETVQTYLSDNSHDEVLLTQLAGIKEQIKHLKNTSSDISSKKDLIETQKELLKEDSTLHEAQQQLSITLKEGHDAIKEQVTETEDAIKALLGNRLLREYQTEYDALMREMAYLRKISDLEEERKKLENGKSCPLCGSEYHPFADGNIPETDETKKKINSLFDLINKAEQLESNFTNLKTKKQNAASKMHEANIKLIQAESKKKESESNLQHLENELNDTLPRFAESQQTILSTLQPFGIKKLPETNFDSLLMDLNNRLEMWQQHQDQKNTIEMEISQLESQLTHLNSTIKTLTASLKSRKDDINTKKQTLNELRADREEKYGIKNPDVEESRLTKLVTEAEKSENTARSSKDQAKQQLSEIEIRIAALKENINSRKPEFETLESFFIEHCKKIGFKSEQNFIANRLSLDERNNLKQQAKELDEKFAEISTRKTDIEDRLNQKIAEKITEQSLEALKNEQTETQKSLTTLREEIGACKQQLSDNKDAKAKYKNKQTLIEKQKKECNKWNDLHELIGSADGNKYRKFAQGLTFELMISHANNQLMKMTDRYLLVRDNNQSLELNVIDNYQAGEIRSTRNLSGGESFIVSLSLSLGLSKMASRKVRVDSLFLDEGFGTLDEEALETALETLSGLQQEDGKLIGIISHVSALKERISTQINVQPSSAGKSTISGPGCTPINVS